MKATGYQLIRLLGKDGWTSKRKGRHGQVLDRWFPDDPPRGRTRVTVVQRSRAVLPQGTPHAILGPKQTGLGSHGLEELIRRWGL